MGKSMSNALFSNYNHLCIYYTVNFCVIKQVKAIRMKEGMKLNGKLIRYFNVESNE